MEEKLIYLLLVIPLIAAALTVVFKSSALRKLIAFLAFVTLGILSLVFIRASFFWGGLSVSEGDVFFITGWFIKTFNIVFSIIFIVIGFRIKKVSVVILAVAQIALLCLIEIGVFGKQVNAGALFNVNLSNSIFMLLLIIFAAFAVVGIGKRITGISIARVSGGEEKEMQVPMIFLITGGALGLLVIQNALWMLCFWQLMIFAAYNIYIQIEAQTTLKEELKEKVRTKLKLRVRTESASEKREPFSSKFLMTQQFGSTLFIIALFLVFLNTQSVEIWNIGINIDNNMIKIAICIFVLAAFIRNGLLPIRFGAESLRKDDIYVIESLIARTRVYMLILVSIPMIYFFTKLAYYNIGSLESQLIAACAAGLFLGCSILMLISNKVSETYTYIVMANISLTFSVVYLRKEFMFWSVLLLLIYNIFIALFIFISEKADFSKRGADLSHSLKTVTFIALCVFQVIFVMKLFLPSPFFYILVIPGCVFQIIYMINLMTIDYKDVVGYKDNPKENIAATAYYLGLNNLRSLTKNKMIIAINICAFVILSLLFGILL